MSASRLFVTPVELVEANAFIAKYHRHHKPVVGHRFSIGCITDDGVLHGVCVVGRPVARLAGAPRDVLEVTRLATDGVTNGCSILYAAAARAGLAMGYKRIQTYTLPEEGGASLRASGWIEEGLAGGTVGSYGREATSHRPADEHQDALGEGIVPAGSGDSHAG